MMDPWNDPVAWRDAMIPPVTFDQALKAARKAKAQRFVWRGVTFDLSAPSPGRRRRPTATTNGIATLAQSAFVRQ